MKRLFRATILAVMMGAVPIGATAVVGGCASGTYADANNYLQARQVYTSSVVLATRLADTKTITLSQAESFEQARAEAHRLLTEWMEAINAGTKFDGMTALINSLDRMAQTGATR